MCVCVCVRERERDRERVKTGRQAGGFTLFILILLKQTNILNVLSCYGFYCEKISAFCLTLLDLPQPDVLPFK